MALHGLVELVKQSREIQNVDERLRSGANLALTGLTGTQKSLILASLNQSARVTLVISHTHQQAERLALDFNTLLPKLSTAVFSPHELLPHEEAEESWDLRKSRLEAFSALSEKDSFVFTSVQALQEAVPDLQGWYDSSIHLDHNSTVDVQRLSEQLAFIGYERTPKVEGFGEFSVRGGIIDVFPFTNSDPIRIELFDDEVDSIRTFAPDDQRSTENLSSVTIFPARELLLNGLSYEAITDKLWNDAVRQAERLEGMDRAQEADALLARVSRHLELLQERLYFPGVKQYYPYLTGRRSLLQSLPESTLVVFDEPARAKDSAKANLQDISETTAASLERGKVLSSLQKVFFDFSELTEHIRGKQLLTLSSLDKRVTGLDQLQSLTVGLQAVEHFHGSLNDLSKRLIGWRKDHYRVLLVTATRERGRALVDHLRENDIPANFVEDVTDQLKAGNIVVTAGGIDTGFVFPAFKLAVCTELEIYGKRKPRSRVRIEENLRVAESELKQRDYVVHVNHGIGQYLGVETLEVAGIHKDYLVVQYAGQDKLYVPTDQIHLLQRYIGLQDGSPRLSKLGGGEWSRVKKRVKESVQELAEGLLKLYAEREAMKGYGFPEDTPWQQEFEEAFPYEETPDQQRAIDEVKGDMERPRPMDRLLCGDVGYGKTEVAVRAAFKAVNDGKQAVVLVPTTILAQQHHRTFVDRFEQFPIRIGVMSRFQSTREQKRVLEGLRQGTIDVVIGTHRMLSKDIKFHDLGLVVVDEEQRFGVVQKERLKEIAKNVDVLTLSATPIPRTLHMAMVGVRDMSLIETPPEDRFPIRTYVMEYDDQVVSQAITRELSRQGQVYCVYNRIRGIERVYSQLQQLVPEARIAIAHGQMDEAYLEQVMLDFYNGEYDILLCTTIIETGMDISNVNTLIIYDADHLGLAQLYQLRGRVGRTNRVAYAYFTYRRDKTLSEDGEKRLQAIKELTDLGSGIKIAMRDLEIRGAGNILGPEQHGFITSVGFELYCRLLDESIRELKGTVVQQPPDPMLDLNTDAYISDEYVTDGAQKVELYKKIMAVHTLDAADELETEVLDRFGDPPAPVQHLLQIARIKVLAKHLGIASISSEKGLFSIKLLAGIAIERDVYAAIVQKFRGRVGYQPGRIPSLRIKVRDLDNGKALELLFDVLKAMQST